MNIAVDPTSSTPLYEQIRESVIERITDGRLQPGAKLPPARELAGQLGISLKTVSAAYRELVADGILNARRREGTFVALRAPQATDKAQRLAYRYIAETRKLGVSDSRALAMVRSVTGGV